MSNQVVLNGHRNSIKAGFKDSSLLSHCSLLLNIMTALLITFAATLVLVHLAAAVGVPPATDLDFLAIAYS